MGCSGCFWLLWLSLARGAVPKQRMLGFESNRARRSAGIETGRRPGLDFEGRGPGALVFLVGAGLRVGGSGAPVDVISP
jgi:hypothetical protein